MLPHGRRVFITPRHQQQNGRAPLRGPRPLRQVLVVPGRPQHIRQPQQQAPIPQAQLQHHAIPHPPINQQRQTRLPRPQYVTPPSFDGSAYNTTLWLKRYVSAMDKNFEDDTGKKINLTHYMNEATEDKWRRYCDFQNIDVTDPTLTWIQTAEHFRNCFMDKSLVSGLISDFMNAYQFEEESVDAYISRMHTKWIAAGEDHISREMFQAHVIDHLRDDIADSYVRNSPFEDALRIARKNESLLNKRKLSTLATTTQKRKVGTLAHLNTEWSDNIMHQNHQVSQIEDCTLSGISTGESSTNTTADLPVRMQSYSDMEALMRQHQQTERTLLNIQRQLSKLTSAGDNTSKVTSLTQSVSDSQPESHYYPSRNQNRRAAYAQRRKWLTKEEWKHRGLPEENWLSREQYQSLVAAKNANKNTQQRYLPSSDQQTGDTHHA